jgi:dolichol-phosphate mannosyltransferase
MDVVYAIRKNRKEGLFKRASYFLYYRILRRLATLDIPLDAGDFCVMRGEVVRAINQLPRNGTGSSGVAHVGRVPTGRNVLRQVGAVRR